MLQKRHSSGSDEENQSDDPNSKLNVHLSNDAVKNLLNVQLMNLETYDDNTPNPSLHKK